MTDETQTLFQEIDEALRADKVALWWESNKQTILGCAIAIVLGTAASVVWRNFADHRAQTATQQLFEAQTLYDAGRYAEAAGHFAVVAEHYSKESSIARLKQAAALNAASQADQANAVLRKGAKDKAINGLMHLQAAQTGALSDDDLLGDVKAGQPFAASARETLALRYIAQGKKKDAAELLNRITADLGAPPQLRERAAQLLHMIEGP